MRKIFYFFHLKINIFCSREILLNIAWACFRNVVTGHILLLLTTLSFMINNCNAGQLCSSCSDVARPIDCHRHITCRNDEQCFQRQFTNASGVTLYDLGCISSQACVNNPLLVGKRSEGPHFNCFSCCNETALCNQRSDCDNAVPTQNVHVCASCSRVSNPMDCLHQELCAKNERCYAYRFSAGIGPDFYDLGCMSESVCLSSPDLISDIKRSEDHHVKCITCCGNGNMCNRNLTCGETTIVNSSLPSDCSEVKRHASGNQYTIYPYGVSNENVNVVCEFDPDGSWTVIQRRFNGSVDFYRNWTEYKRGFGSSNGEYWIGNEIIHQLTSHGNYTLKVVLTDWNNTVKYAEYSVFRIGSETDNYRLTIGGYSGDAGDSLAYHNGGQFSTWDRNNDYYPTSQDCVQSCGRGAWWHTDCCVSSLNAVYYNYHSRAFAVEWLAWHGFHYSLKTTKMMIKRT